MPSVTSAVLIYVPQAVCGRILKCVLRRALTQHQHLAVGSLPLAAAAQRGH